jgi:chemotaxis protein methyltransferase CheR
VTALTEQDFHRFRTLIYETAGISLTDNKRAMLIARLSRRLRALRVESYASYLDRVERDRDELAEMLDCVTTNETRFFREQKQFDHLQNVLIPRLLGDAKEGRRERSLRAWSAGCATGEEPYSLAMALLDGLPDWEVAITATDISTRVLEYAARAVWPVEKAAHIPERLLKRYMLRGRGSQQGKMKAGPEIRGVVQFYRMNLNDAEYPIGGGFDLILCRNVLIYFDADSRRRTVERLLNRLTPSGRLFVGHAETLHGVTTRARAVVPTIYALVT